MNDFVIYTDSACDIPPELLKEWGVPYSWPTYVFDGDARQYSNFARGPMTSLPQPRQRSLKSAPMRSTSQRFSPQGCCFFIVRMSPT